MRAKLTKKVIESLVRTPGYVWDADVRGLALRVLPSGRLFWSFRYRARGRQRFISIGEHGQPWTVDTARDEARRLQGLVASKVDPAAKRDRDRYVSTLEEAAKGWIRLHGEKHKAPESVAGDRALLARLGKMTDLVRYKVDAVTRDQVQALHRRMENTPTQANRALALLSTVFTFCGRIGADNPCRGVKRYREERRERILSDVELGRLGETLVLVQRLNDRGEEGGESPITVGAIVLLLLTGARPKELMTARLEWVDLERGTLLVPRPKEKRPKTIRLGPHAITVIRGLPKYRNNTYLLPGRRKGAHLVNIHDAWARIRKLAGIEDVRLYDLRHTYASVLARDFKESLPRIGALLGHRRPETTARYVHLLDDPLRAIADAAGQRIATVLKGEP